MRRLTPAGVSTMMVVVVGLLVTAYFAKLMRADEPHSPATTQPQPVELRSVPTAVSTLEPGTVITAAHLGTGRVRADALASDALVQERSAIGRTVKERIAAASVIRSGQLYPPGESPQPKVSRGMRAVSIPLTRTLDPNNGLLKAGQYVDVYLTPQIDVANDSRHRGGMTLTLLRGVRLLAVTPDALSDESSGLITLELTPEQATVLILAREKGKLALSYNPEGKGDSGIALANRDRATFDEILGAPAPAPSGGGPAADTLTTELYKGSTRSTRQFDRRAMIAPPETSTRIDASRAAPLWTRKSLARSLPSQAADRVAAAPDRGAVEK